MFQEVLVRWRDRESGLHFSAECDYVSGKKECVGEQLGEVYGYVWLGGQVIVTIEYLTPVILDNDGEGVGRRCGGMPVREECVDSGLYCLWVRDAVTIGVNDVGEVESGLLDLENRLDASPDTVGFKELSTVYDGEVDLGTEELSLAVRDFSTDDLMDGGKKGEGDIGRVAVGEFN